MMLSDLKKLYRKTYNALCGTHPNVYPWHYQWLSTSNISATVDRALAHIPENSNVLDVGCGNAPYRDRLPAGCKHTGIDIDTGEGKPDITIEPGKPWPLPDATYDIVLCNQVLEHTGEPDLLISECKRALKPGGILILSVPFIYNEHGMPWDYRRFTVGGLTALLQADYNMLFTAKSGRIGTVLATLLLNWGDEAMTKCKPVRLMKPILLPFWIIFSLMVNIPCWLLDKLDSTGSFYLDTMFVGKKR